MSEEHECSEYDCSEGAPLADRQDLTENNVVAEARRILDEVHLRPRHHPRNAFADMARKACEQSELPEPKLMFDPVPGKIDAPLAGFYKQWIEKDDEKLMGVSFKELREKHPLDAEAIRQIKAFGHLAGTSEDNFSKKLADILGWCRDVRQKTHRIESAIEYIQGELQQHGVKAVARSMGAGEPADDCDDEDCDDQECCVDDDCGDDAPQDPHADCDDGDCCGTPLKTRHKLKSKPIFSEWRALAGLMQKNCGCSHPCDC